MLSFYELFQRVQWPKALIGLSVSCVAAFSVHTVMLQVAHVPYPTNFPATGWAIFSGLTLSAFALVWCCQLAADRLNSFPVLGRLVLVGALAVMLREGLRVIIMEGVVTTAWRYSVVNDIARPLTMMALAWLAVLSATYLQGWRKRLGGALLIAAPVNYLISPAVKIVRDRVLLAMASLSHDEVYKAPYGWRVEVSSYATFLEPTIAVFVLAALVWDRLSLRPSVRMLQFAFLVMGINTILLRPLLYLPFSPFTLPVSLLNVSQFFFESLVLAVAVGSTWMYADRRRIQPL